MTYRPPDCTEREPDGSWEDCTWCSGICLGNAAHEAKVYPPTQAEYEALRKASGDTMVGGSSLRDLQAGMLARWGWTGHLLVRPTWSLVWSALKPNVGAVVQGSMGSIPVHYRRWDPDFGASGRLAPHAFYVQREANEDRVWLINPQAPRGYAGEWLAKRDLERYFKGLPGAEAMWVQIGARAGLLPDTDEEADLDFRIVRVVAGTATVTIDGAQLVTMENGRVNVPKGQTREVCAEVEILDDIDNGQDVPGDRKSAYLVGRDVKVETTNVRAAFLLKSAAKGHLVKVEAIA